jgi:hypothetical protein
MHFIVITAGDIVEVLLGFVNNGDREFNITSVSASLNHPLDHRYYIQNVCLFLFVPLHPISIIHLFHCIFFSSL